MKEYVNTLQFSKRNIDKKKTSKEYKENQIINKKIKNKENRIKEVIRIANNIIFYIISFSFIFHCLYNII